MTWYYNSPSFLFPFSMTDNSSSSSSSSASSPTARIPLVKQKSWSPDLSREEAWLRRKGIHQDRRRQVDGTLTRSVTDEDLDELRGCIDLGFGFDLDSALSESDSSSSRSLADTFPALDLYYAVNREYSDAVAGVRSPSSSGSDSSPLSIYSPGESPEQVKARLKQWAQVVACSVRQQRSC